MISAITKYKLEQFCFIQFAWIVAVLLFVAIRYTSNLDHPQPGIIATPLPTHSLFFFSTLVGATIGMIVGLMAVFIHPKMVQTKSFLVGILIKLTGFVLVIFIISALTAYVIFYHLGESPWEQTKTAIVSPSFFILSVYGILVNTLLDTMLQLNQRLGPGTIKSILLGKYFKPKVENRIFMFLDLASSTSIAESLGHVQFSHLLQDCYNDLSKIYLKYGATPYQFVGDEAVITWDFETGIKNDNYLKFFYEFESILNAKASYYQKQYGFVPSFPAAVNAGEVTVTEVGQIKSELAYHGDVLNAASRIQKLCKLYGENILITEHLASHTKTFQVARIENVHIEGRRASMEIFKIAEGKLRIA